MRLASQIDGEAPASFVLDDQVFTASRLQTRNEDILFIVLDIVIVGDIVYFQQPQFLAALFIVGGYIGPKSLGLPQ